MGGLKNAISHTIPVRLKNCGTLKNVGKSYVQNKQRLTLARERVVASSATICLGKLQESLKMSR
ncbi:hypothetical protein J6590_056580 [Homalodisca vitripennis]|nr:hypothetical protein J6590_056580 [Homalodisca vitripennis]